MDQKDLDLHNAYGRRIAARVSALIRMRPEILAADMSRRLDIVNDMAHSESNDEFDLVYQLRADLVARELHLASLALRGESKAA